MRGSDWFDRIVLDRLRQISVPPTKRVRVTTGTHFPIAGHVTVNSPKTPFNIMSHPDDLVAPSPTKPHVSEFEFLKTRSCDNQSIIQQEVVHNGDAANRFIPTVSSFAGAENQQLHDSSTKSLGPSASAKKERCQVLGCMRFSRDRRARRCIRHGGGRRCALEGCGKAAKSSADFCIAHGGGRRCFTAGCTKSSAGPLQLCIAHGGGKRCQRQGCPKAAQGKTGLCIAHGGGRRCQRRDCTRSSHGASLCCRHYNENS